jgi:TfoX/Sxy family transcriptional regulator of competence genes
MAYDEHLGERISHVLKERRVQYEAKNMMGGLCFMINDKMAVGVIKDSLMARIDPEIYESSLRKKGCRPMDFTGRIMKGFVRVDPIGIDSDEDLEYWIQVCLDFNPKAKSSRKSEGTKRKPAAKKAKK